MTTILLFVTVYYHHNKSITKVLFVCWYSFIAKPRSACTTLYFTNWEFFLKPLKICFWSKNWASVN